MSGADDLDRLDDYANGILSDADAEAFEAQLFAAAQAGEAPEAQFLQRLTEDLTWLKRRGQLVPSHTRESIRALRAGGERIHYTDLGSGGSVEVPLWPPDTERVIFHLRVDLRGYEQVEVEARLANGASVTTFRDCQHDAEDGNAYAVCLEPVARMSLGSLELHWRVTGMRGGKRELITTYDTRPVARR